MKFEKDYYINSSTSNYINYADKKFDDLFSNLSQLISKEDYILDFGCATGGLVHSFYINGYTNIKGTDISYWAINYGRKQYGLSNEILHHYNRQLLEWEFSYAFFLDVLEHIPIEELDEILSLIKNIKKIIVRVPVSRVEGENFVLDVSKNDKTHIQIHEKDWWIDLLSSKGFTRNEILNMSSIYESEGVLARIFYRE